jgi:uncharacterized protein YegP (UPF0339 family)
MKFLIYQDVTLAWRWQLVSGNGQIMADSSEGYIDKTNVREAVDTIVENIKSGKVAIQIRDA